MNDGDYTKEDFLEIYKVKYRLTVSSYKPVEHPKAFVLGGQPGAGKTGLQEIMKQKVDGNLVILNGDEYRELHPDFQYLQDKYGKDSVEYTGGFSATMTEALMVQLKKAQYNVLVEDTLRTAKVPLDTCDKFKSSGYNVTLALIAVKPQLSYISTILRYEDLLAEGKTPRATPKDKHDYVVAHLTENLKKIYDSGKFDNIIIYNRQGECLYDMSANQTSTPDAVMDKALNGRWTQDELEQFIEIGNKTQALMENRKAEELSQFKSEIFNKVIVEDIAKRNELDFGNHVNKPDSIQPENSVPVHRPRRK